MLNVQEHQRALPMRGEARARFQEGATRGENPRCEAKLSVTRLPSGIRSGPGAMLGSGKSHGIGSRAEC